MQTLKSSDASRVRTDAAERLAGQRMSQGEGSMCPAGAGDIHTDVYGRPVTQNTLTLLDASCGMYTKFSAQRRIAVENSERPYLPICAAGLRGAADFAAIGRDINPKNVYGEGDRGRFVRDYATANNGPPQAPAVHTIPVAPRAVQPFRGSHDATSTNSYRG